MRDSSRLISGNPVLLVKHASHNHVVVVMPSSRLGGAQRHASLVAKAVKASGHSVTFACARGDGIRPILEELEIAGVRTRQIGLRETDDHNRTRHSEISDLLTCLRLFVKYRPRFVVVMLPWPTTGSGCLLAAACCGIPTLAIFQLVCPGTPLGTRRKRSLLFSLRRGLKVAAVSGNNRNLLAGMLGVDESDLHYIPNGVPSPRDGELETIRAQRAELLRSIGIAPDAQMILSVGRISPQKGHDLIIPAINHIAHEFPRVKFLWLGAIDEAWRSELRARLERHGGSECVLILDHVSDPRAYYASADLFLFPSRCEGQSLALAEAMSFGLPIVVSDASGNTELIRPDQDGIVFRSEDPCDLMEALRRALRTPDLMRSLAKSAQERVKMFSEERMLRETMRILGIESSLGAC